MRRGARPERAKETRETRTATAAAKGWERQRLQQWRQWRRRMAATARVQAPATAAVPSRLHRHLAEHRWARRTRPRPPTWHRGRSWLRRRRGDARRRCVCDKRSDQRAECANSVGQQGRWTVGSRVARAERGRINGPTNWAGGLAHWKDNLDGNAADFGQVERRG